MLFEQGTVIAVEPDGLWLETLKLSSCKQCSAQKGCGQKLLVKSAAAKMTFIKAVFPKVYFDSHPKQSVEQQWQIGDIAEIAIDELALVNATFIAYGVPLFTMLIAALAANYLLFSDVYVALLAFVGLFLGGILVRWHSRINIGDSGYNAKVIRKIIISSS